MRANTKHHIVIQLRFPGDEIAHHVDAYHLLMHGVSLDVLAVGMDRFAAAVDDDLAAVTAGSAIFKAVRGEYGSGKTFYARWVAQRAMARGLATAGAEALAVTAMDGSVDDGTEPGLDDPQPATATSAANAAAAIEKRLFMSSRTRNSCTRLREHEAGRSSAS